MPIAYLKGEFGFNYSFPVVVKYALDEAIKDHKIPQDFLNIMAKTFLSEYSAAFKAGLETYREYQITIYEIPVPCKGGE